jgi:hypothetical protein
MTVAKNHVAKNRVAIRDTGGPTSQSPMCRGAPRVALPTVAASHHADHLRRTNSEGSVLAFNPPRSPRQGLSTNARPAVSYDEKPASSADALLRPSLTPIVDPDKFDACREHSSKHKTKG